jgi:hypothetical protein
MCYISRFYFSHLKLLELELYSTIDKRLIETKMMQATSNHETEAQISVNLKDVDYDYIMSIGFPFVPAKRVDINQEGINIEDEVETTCVEGGTPMVLEGWHRHPKWKKELFTFQYLEEKYGNEGREILKLLNIFFLGLLSILYFKLKSC